MRTPKASRTIWNDATAAAQPPDVWLVGDWGTGEFADVRRTLDPAIRWREHLTPEGAWAVLSDGTSPPELALLAQPRPGCIDQSCVDRLQIAAPLMRIVIVAGAWCEGELRTGRPLIGAARLYWHQLPAWWARSLAQRAARFPPMWSRMPDSARPSELTPTTGAAKTIVAVDAIDFAVFETLEAALHPYGWSCVWMRPNADAIEAASLGVWDGGQLDAGDCASLARFCQRFGALPAPVVALVDFLRVEHFKRLHTAGASALLGKPYDVASLVHELTRVSTSVPLPSKARS